MTIALAVPPVIQDLVQKGLLERAFHDALFPALLFRADALKEEWPANTGEEVIMTRPSLLAPVTTPLTPGQDPTPQVLSFEQWFASLVRYGSSIDTHMPTSVSALANLFMRNTKQLGLNAGQSMNRIARNAIVKPYLSGRTNLIAATAATDTSIRVAALNGFTDVIVLSQAGPNPSARPVPVSPSTPLPITIGTGAGAVSANVIGISPDNPADPYGPGTLQLAAQVGSIVAVRTIVVSSVAPRIVRSGGASSIDGITGADTFALQDAINAVAFLRQDNVQPHDDGFYHAHISSIANAQVFADPVFQRLNQSLPEHVIYKEGFIGSIGNVLFYLNNESPDDTNSGTLVPTQASAVYASDIGAEVKNASGVRIGRILITGKGAMYERYRDESQYVSEAGVVGKIGEFAVVNNGLAIMTDLIRLYIRAPIDRLGDIVSATWSISTSFPIPSDIAAPTSPGRYKRAILLEHALG